MKFAVKMAGLISFLFFYGLLDYPGALAQKTAAVDLPMIQLFPTGFAIPLAAFLLASAIPMKMGGMRYCVACSAMGFSGVACLMGALAGVFLPRVLLVAALVLLSSALALGFALWITLLAGETPEKGFIIIVVAHLMESSLQMAFNLSATPELLACLLASFLMVSLLCAFGLSEEGLFRIAAVGSPVYLRRHLPIGRFWQLLLCLFLLGISLEVVRAFVLSSFADSSLGYSTFAIGRLIASVLVLVLWRRVSAFLCSNGFILFVYVAVIAEFAICPMFASLYPAIFLVFSDILMSIVFISVLACGAEAVRDDPICAFPWTCTFLCAMYAGGLIGGIVGELVEQQMGFGTLGMLVLAVVICASVCAAGIIMGVLRDRKMFGGFESPVESSFVAGESKRNLEVVSEGAPGRADALKNSFGLTSRETDVLVLLLQGHTVSSMSNKLFISENTIRSHMKTLYAKLGVHNKREVLAIAEAIDTN